MSNDLLQAALDHAARGIPVFPTNPRSKKPFIPKAEGGHGFKDATTDPEQIRAWWTKYPNAQISMPTGKPTGFTVVDIDPRHGGDKTLIKWMSGNKLDCNIVKTGGGGLHLYFIYDKRFRIAASPKGSDTEGVDFRSDGGYVVVPPSKHSSGGVYNGEIKAWSTIPDWLADPLLARKRTKVATKLDDEPIKEGGRNETLFRIGSSLRGAGWHESEIAAHLRAINGKRCVPPLDDEDVEVIIKQACGYERGITLEEQKEIMFKENPSLRPSTELLAAEPLQRALRLLKDKVNSKTITSLAALDVLEPSEALQAWKALRKHKDVLAGLGIDVETIKKPELPKRKHDLSGVKRKAEPLIMPEPIHGAVKRAVYEKIRAFIKRRYWFREEDTYDLCALYVINTYLQRVSNIAPFLIFHGLTVSGKTQATHAVALLCHKGFVGLDPSVPAIFRLIDDFPGITLFLDEFTFDWKAAQRDPDAQDLFKLLRGSFTRGAYVLRVEETDVGRVAVGYDAFGPKGFNTTRIEGLPEDLLNRALVILCLEPPMEERWREPIAFIDTPEAQEIRAEILGIIEDSNTTPLTPIDLSEFNSDLRLRDMGKTLALAAAIFEERDVLLKFLRSEFNARRERLQDSLNGQILAVVKVLIHREKKEPVSMKAIRDAWGIVHEVETWQDKNGKSRDNIPWAKTIAGRLGKLGLELTKEHTRKTTATYITGLDEPNSPSSLLLARLLVNYGLGDQIGDRIGDRMTDVTDSSSALPPLVTDADEASVTDRGEPSNIQSHQSHQSHQSPAAPPESCKAPDGSPSHDGYPCKRCGKQ